MGAKVLTEPTKVLSCGCVVGQGGTIHSPCQSVEPEYERLRGLVRSGDMSADAKRQREGLEKGLAGHIRSVAATDRAAARRAAKAALEAPSNG